MVGAVGLVLGFCLIQVGAGGGDKKDNAFAPAKPGPEHKLLAATEGTWDAKVKSWFGPGEPKESTGVLTRKPIMDGLYLEEGFQGEFLGMKFKGRGLLGYDVHKKKYLFAWIDNFGTGLTVSEGTYDPATKTWTYLGEEESPTFGKMKMRDVLTLVGKDEMQFEMYRTPAKSGKEMKVMEITYTRKAAAKKGT
jgi:hypothetical protein